MTGKPNLGTKSDGKIKSMHSEQKLEQIYLRMASLYITSHHITTRQTQNMLIRNIEAQFNKHN